MQANIKVSGKLARLTFIGNSLVLNYRYNIKINVKGLIKNISSVKIDL